MPSKKDQYSSPSQKVLGLFGLLFFKGRKFSLSELAKEFDCSKQTVLRMIEQIQRSHAAKIKTNIEHGKRWFWIRTPRIRPSISLEPEKIQHLLLCRDMAGHLLPKRLWKEIESTIAQTTVLLPDMADRSKALEPVCQVSVKGAIDYTPYQGIIEKLLQAIREKSVCRVEYHAPHRPKPKVYSFAPARLLSYRESLYADGWLVTDKGTPEIIYDLTLSVHRVNKISIIRRKFDFDDKREDTSDMFGFMKAEPFQVKVKFQPRVAQYVRERKWSDDQKITEFKNGKLVLEFTAQSWPEVVSWVLGFGSQAELLTPKEMREEILEEFGNALRSYRKKNKT